MDLPAVLEAPTTPSEAPTTPTKRLTRDQRQDILLLRSLEWTYEKISNHLKITYQGVQYTCELGTATPKKHTGRPSQLTEEQIFNFNGHWSIKIGPLSNGFLYFGLMRLGLNPAVIQEPG
ncbi:conserved hypothetical protein [Histoplasma mississippiense (nom. inval.)]|uniref:conserved hypothetical protein n=1 Tax=Ajellomyces capsulatus (strain NAm1 / WU24) TaxID=2059318 RepID=UPI000157BC29|nr:conserved hypothetical protein [Histoplasma mississippiense (nom. inval.)]EDN05860.1 conserved hypothetical protein [Histoplasma mississippiense (nom. inval.)]